MSLHELDGECVLYDNVNGKVHVLNHSARFIWSQCAAPVTTDELCCRLQEKYGIDDTTASTDIATTVNTFLDRTILKQVEQ